MRRREFIALLASVFVWPVSAVAQQTASVPRIGFITTGSIDLIETRSSIAAFRKGLRELGYVEGQNIVIEIKLLT